MSDKKAILCIAIGLVALLSLSLFITLSEKEETVKEAVIVIEERTDEITEATAAKAAEYTTAVKSAEPEVLYININEASTEELCKLDGIGEKIASEIIAYREQNEGFRNIEEIMNVKGIGEAVFLGIRSNIYVENPVYESFTTTTDSVVTTTVTTETPPVYPVNINTATAEELMTLPNIDGEEALAIIELRERIGGYSHPYELLYIEELEQKEVAEIIEFVTVGK